VPKKKKESVYLDMSSFMEVSPEPSEILKKIKQRGVSHCGLAIYIETYLKCKRRIMKTQIFHHAKI
jgi:Na+-translocating ferredoxin:NAD+ oxidoreductase RnfC subunit